MNNKIRMYDKANRSLSPEKLESIVLKYKDKMDKVFQDFLYDLKVLPFAEFKLEYILGEKVKSLLLKAVEEGNDNFAYDILRYSKVYPEDIYNILELAHEVVIRKKSTN